MHRERNQFEMSYKREVLDLEPRTSLELGDQSIKRSKFDLNKVK